MKTKYLLLAVIVFLAAGGVYYFFTRPKAPQPTVIEQLPPELLTTEPKQEKDKTFDLTKTPPTGAAVYNLSDESLVKYVAQKRFFQKEDALVTGVTNDVTGSGWFFADDQSIYLEAKANLSTLTTDSPQRDSDVTKLFTDNMASFIVDFTGVESVTIGSDLNLQVPGKIKINGVEKEVAFTVTGRLDEEQFTAEGSTKVLMSDFGINPPSLINVFTVDDEIELQFDVVGTRITQ